ncbi:MAG TPA: hypothetical protein VF557_11495 [Jatrophihabitans sp.]|jgi:hypothetical protein|uniref:hypothetical protein n=1 Tax=Jatrophihabitans sp. TaxID=1932789 RepID=UPI002EEA0984
MGDPDEDDKANKPSPGTDVAKWLFISAVGALILSTVTQLQADYKWTALVPLWALATVGLVVWGSRRPDTLPLVQRLTPVAAGLVYLATTVLLTINPDIPTVWRVTLPGLAFALYGLSVALTGELDRPSSTRRMQAATVGGGVAALGLGVAALGFGVAVLMHSEVGFGVAGLGAGVAALGIGVAALMHSEVGFGVTMLGAGVALLGMGAAALMHSDVGFGVAMLGAGVAMLGFGVDSLMRSDIGFGVAMLGLGVAVLGWGGAVVKTSHSRG